MTSLVERETIGGRKQFSLFNRFSLLFLSFLSIFYARLRSLSKVELRLATVTVTPRLPILLHLRDGGRERSYSELQTIFPSFVARMERRDILEEFCYLP